MVPPSPGSGGHTTAFMVSALERAGHECVIYMQDRHGWALDRHRGRIKSCWPDVRAEVRDLAEGIQASHVILATGWGTAYPVLASPARGTRCYLVQDHEPSFYAAGSEAMLAQATYRFGFHGVTAGPWLAKLLRETYGMAADHFDFGCDLERKFPRSLGPRRQAPRRLLLLPAVAPRRAHELAVAALDLFAERHPEVEIHLYGERAGRLPFSATAHGLRTPGELAELYNRCVAGLVLSATNVSLVPTRYSRPGASRSSTMPSTAGWCSTTSTWHTRPARRSSWLDALCELVERPLEARAATAQAAWSSVRSMSWAEAGVQVEEILRAVVWSYAKSEPAA